MFRIHLHELSLSNFLATDPIAQANPKLAQLKDDDGRLPIHWAVSYNHPEIVSLLISQKGFDPDAEVGLLVSDTIFAVPWLINNRMTAAGHPS